MADFEALIRDALAKQDTASPTVRQKVYQSSRNALERMISKMQNASPEIIAKQRKALEVSIQRIETEFNSTSSPGSGATSTEHASAVRPTRQVQEGRASSAPEASSTPVAASGTAQVKYTAPAVEGSRQTPEPAPKSSTTAGSANVSSKPADQSGGKEDKQEAAVSASLSHDAALDQVELVDATGYDHYSGNDFSAPPPELRRKRKWPLRWLVVLVFMALFFALGYYLYLFLMNYVTEYNSNPPTREELNSENNGNVRYLNILEPGDTSSLVVSDRGKAEIIESSGDKKLIQIQSVRGDNVKRELAKPILIELKPGVLKDIAGHEVNVEIHAKSGGSEPTQFSVECQFGDDDESNCGRKRFRVGLQPEAVVFSIKADPNLGDREKAYLAINTDITKSANVSGQGELLDIYYARIRLAEK